MSTRHGATRPPHTSPPRPARRTRTADPHDRHRATASRARRVSGPAHAKRDPRAQAPAAPPRAHAARRAVAARAVAALAPAARPALRLVEGARGLSAARAVDRLVTGRLWIALVAVGLMGIVAMQVHTLGLNAGIGRAVETASTLERQNAELQRQVSQLSSSERLAEVAERQGLTMPPAGAVKYLAVRPGDFDARQATGVMRAPDPAAPPAGVTLPPEPVAPVATGEVVTPRTPAPAPEPAPAATPAPAAGAVATPAPQPQPTAPPPQTAPQPQPQADPAAGGGGVAAPPAAAVGG